MSDYAQRLKAILGLGPNVGHVTGLPSDFFPKRLWTPPSGGAAPRLSVADGVSPEVVPEAERADVRPARAPRTRCASSRKPNAALSMPQVLRAEPERRKAYRVNDAAHLLSISRSTMYKMRKAGSLEMIDIGGRTLVSHDEIERLLSAKNSEMRRPSQTLSRSIVTNEHATSRNFDRKRPPTANGSATPTLTSTLNTLRRSPVPNLHNSDTRKSPGRSVINAASVRRTGASQLCARHSRAHPHRESDRSR